MALVRLRDYDRVDLGLTAAPFGRFPMRTFRHAGMLYERVADGADGLREYRATERQADAPPRVVTVISASGADLGTVAIPAGELPSSVIFAATECPLWTSRDQQGRALYLMPESPDGV